MRNATLLALLLLSNLTMPSPASAGGLDGEPAEVGLSWRLGFGGAGPLEPGLGLTLGYRGEDPFSRRLLGLDLDAAGGSVRLAGLPLLATRYRTAQTEGETADAPEQNPWYTRQWVYWTAGGIALMLASTGGDGDLDICQNCNDGGGGGGSNIVSVDNGEVCGTEGVDGVPDSCTEVSGCTPGDNACVNCDDSTVTQDCGGGWTARPIVLADLAARDAEPAWLSAGTGYMGDLFRR
jgi:hypothetical protein